MANRWTYRSMVDGEIDLTPQQRRAAEQRMVEISKRSPRAIWTMVLVVIASVAVCGLSARPLVRTAQREFRVTRTVATMIVMVPMFITISVGASMVFWRMYRRPMRQALSEMGHEVCINCGHQLRGLLHDSKHCPECGHPRTHRADMSPTIESEVEP